MYFSFCNHEEKNQKTKRDVRTNMRINAQIKFLYYPLLVLLQRLKHGYILLSAILSQWGIMYIFFMTKLARVEAEIWSKLFMILETVKIFKIAGRVREHSIFLYLDVKQVQPKIKNGFAYTKTCISLKD